MSRETDSPSSGPNGSNGRGGAAYPSGTPPYGTPAVTDGAADAGRSTAQPEERKTETTLTTRIRINIPGSRPIPPVVVRKPVAGAESTAEQSGAPGSAAQPPGPSAPTAAAVGGAGAAGAYGGPAEAPAEPAPAAEEKTSDWFAPRKSGPAKGPQAPGNPNTPALGPGSGPAPGGAPAGPPPAAGRPGAAPGGPRPGGTNGAGLPGGGHGTNGAGMPGGATGGPVAPGHGGGTGSFDVTEALAGGPAGNGRRPAPGPEATRGDLPYFTGDQTPGAPDGGPGLPGGPGAPGGPGQGYPGPGGPAGGGAPGGFPPGGPADPLAPGSPYDFTGPDTRTGGPGPQGPTGPTGGPVTGDGPVVPPLNAAHPDQHGQPGQPAHPGHQADLATTAGFPAVPGTPAQHPGAGFGDDTAELTPQYPGAEHGAGHGQVPGGPGRHDNVSGQTVTSGIPVVPPGGPGPRQSGGPGGPFPPGGPTDGPLPHTPPQAAAPAPAPAAGAQKKAKKKGRSKLVLLGVLVVVAAAGAYGAGLLMNHSDVPKGTTVLGVDIGGGTRDDAVKKLDAAFDDRVNQGLKLSVDGDTVVLKPDQAGLQFDMQATVDAAARSDYNPVSVIGSLFGEQRVVEPVMPVDEEKLAAALETAAGGAGSAKDGTITFGSGKATAVYGKPGKGIDTGAAQTAVIAAYRTQVQSGKATAVRVPTTAKQPTVSNAEVDRMMKEFAKPAMSGTVTVQTDAAHSIRFSPENSLWKFLEVKAVDGKLVESYNEAALKELYGGTFDGVLITRGTGQKTGVTVQDVIGALRPALKSTTDRTATIDTDPS
ncbi:hypothetical protein ACFWNK_24965 [Streptomyces sp. NPDC058417]|uniref:hypothetical protein n=4 Tax=Streptomyces TaxID=1883 RepID=UPI0036589144